MLLNELMEHPAFPMLSMILAILGVLLAFLFYFLSKKDKTPCFDSSNNTVIESVDKNINGLEIRYKNIPQERITVTKIVFWNDGKGVINRSDLVQKDPLRIICPKNIEVLDVQILIDQNNLNSVEVGVPISDDNGRVNYPISFDYLDHKDHFTVQLVHNGKSYSSFYIRGKIKGVKRIDQAGDMRLTISLIRAIPFSIPFIKLLESKFFLKYIGSISYLFMGILSIWKLFNGNTQWYFWAGAALFPLATCIMFYGFRRISPVKI